MLPRTYIASNGLDTNDGRLGTPCRSIGAALAQTDPGGEIIVLDSAGYGAVAINKSVSVIAPPGVFAGITVTAGTGIDVTAGTVTLRGLTLRGSGGAIGIHVGNAIVHVDGCAISGLAQFGIHADVANGEVYVRDTQIAHCAEGLRFEGNVRFALDRVSTEGNGNTGLNVLAGAHGSARGLMSGRNGNQGVVVQNGTAGAECYLALDGALIAGNGNSAISVSVPAPVAGKSNLTITRSTLANNGADGVLVSTQGAGAATAVVSDCVIDGNVLRGVAAMGAGAIAVVCGNQITRNAGVGLAQSGGGTLKTEQDNLVDGNNQGGAQTLGALTAVAAV
ncbi:MAG: right-handed parallel beta-helix repeat-containing protein [Casimicrobiaceae bacterium]